MVNHFSHSANSPFHLSVGAVLIDESHKVACHFFENIADSKTGDIYKDTYILMRETLEPNETLEQAVARGLAEEFGAKGEIMDFIGAQSISFQRENYQFYKTTLYFLVQLTSIDVSKRLSNDPEGGSEIQWQDIDFLIGKMNAQVPPDYREDMNESDVLARAESMLEKLRRN
jgi:hypothetical protein